MPDFSLVCNHEGKFAYAEQIKWGNSRLDDFSVESLFAGLAGQHQIDSLANTFAGCNFRLQLPSLYGKRWSSYKAERVCALFVFTEALLHFRAVHVPAEALWIEAEIPRVSKGC